MPTCTQTDNQPTTEARKPWQTPDILYGEANETQKDALTVETTFAGPS